jgi:O-antigen biosynthesis protein
MPSVSIITALHNCVELTQKYVESLIRTMDRVDWELILVDDASSDNTPAYLDSLSSDRRVRCIRNPENKGYSASNNIGAQHAKSVFFAFLNNDLFLTPGWFEPMLDAFENTDNPGIIGNIQINPRSGLIDHAGVFFGLDGMPRQARKNRKTGPRSEYTEWNAVTAACMLMKASLFHEIGGFDETYRNGFEDIDLCVRLRLKGYRHYVANRSRIDHRVSASPGRHHNNDRNTELFRDQWTSVTREWGKREWAPEYIERYARHWWKFNLGKLLLAQRMLIQDQFKKRLWYRK